MSISQLFPEEGPTLNLNFAGSKTLDPRITFSRTSTATYMDDSGLIKVAPADAPRFDHRYVNGEIESLGLLVEESRSNYVRYSEELDNTSVWGRSNVGITTNATISPTGELTAEKIIDDTTVSTQHWLRVRATGLSATGTYTASVYVKFDPENNLNERGISLTITDAETGGSSYSAIRVFEGGNYAITADSFTNTTGNVDTLPNGWYRVHLIFTNVGATTELSLRLQLTTSAGGAVYTGDGSSGVFAWGAQLEAGAFPTSYIPRPSTSTATRNPDNVSMEGDNFSYWYNPTEGTIVLDCTPVYDNSSNQYRRLLSIHNNSGAQTDVIQFIQAEATNQVLSAVWDGASPQSGFGKTLLSGTRHKVAFAVKENNMNASYDGNIGTDDTSATLPVMTEMDIGSYSQFSGNRATAHYNSLRYYPTRLTNTQLQTLTK